MILLDGFTFWANKSRDTDEFIGRCAEYPSLSWHAPHEIDALIGIIQLVRDTEAAAS